MTLRVGLDYRPALLLRSGIGRYVRDLVDELGRGGPQDDVCLELFAATFRRVDPPAPPPSAENVRVARGRVPGRVQQWLGIPVERWTGVVDVFHATDYVAVKTRAPLVVTVHDLSFVRDPSCHPARNVRRLERVTDAAVARAAVVLTPSAATREDVLEHYGLDEDRVVVAPHGVGRDWFDIERRPAGRPVVLAVGTIEPRKNHARLIRAFRDVLARGHDAELHLCGRRGWLCDDVFELLGEPALAGRVTWSGDADDLTVRRLTGEATVCAYPSTLEGFGLPILEAMAAGAPVLTSDVGAMKEVAGAAALLVDPLSVDDIAAGLDRLLTDDALRDDLARRGVARARAFTWTRSAHIHRDAYRRAASSPPPTRSPT